MIQQQPSIDELRVEREMTAAQLINLKEQREAIDASVQHLTGRYRFLNEEITRWAMAEREKEQQKEVDEKKVTETPVPPTPNPFEALKAKVAEELAPAPAPEAPAKVSPIGSRKRGKK